MSDFYCVHVDFNISSELASDELRKLIDSQINSLGLLTNKYIRVSKSSKDKGKITLGEFKIEEVLPHITTKRTMAEFQCAGTTYFLKMNRSRYLVFQKSLKCGACGLEGIKFLLEMYGNTGNPHFNLYGFEDGVHVLMTKDHIIPKSKDGPNSLDNYITMCAICNNLKGNFDLTMEEVNSLRRLFNENKNLSSKQRAALIQESRRSIMKGKS